ncbi:PAS domain S-box protein [Arcobacteraceae bacterium]|nr:PAS domain S-box protein [Arcobacteraceae bacterium]
MKYFKAENILFGLSILILTIFIYIEFVIKTDMYKEEKINDLNIQYKSKLIINDKIIDALFDELLNDIDTKFLIAQANKNINKDENRKKLLYLYKLKFKGFKKRGIKQLHFHLANGKSFLRLHKPKAYGDDLLFRKNIQKIIQTHKKVAGFEIGKYFEGYRYIYPLFYGGEYIGSVEAAVDTHHVLVQMKELLGASFNIVIKTEELHKDKISNNINNKYHMFSASEDYIMPHIVDNKEDNIKSLLYKIKDDIRSNLSNNKAFVTFSYDKQNNTQIFVFVPILDVNNNNIGYFFSTTEDNAIKTIIFMQVLKYAIALILLSFLFYFYKQTKTKTKTIEQLTIAIDKTTLVSRTDLKGRITYVNDAFIKISGYTQNELLRSHHNIVRDQSTNKDIFKEMWSVIRSKKIWNGIITNKRKDGSKYTVNATIMPILDVDGDIIEYIAIRHDITEVEKYKEILKEKLEDKTKTLEENLNYTQQYEIAINDSTAVLKTDTKNNIIFTNSKFCKISGYNKEELIGINCRDLRHENHIKMNDCENIITTLKDKKTVSMVFTNLTKNNEIFFLDTIIHPILNTKGEVIEHLHLMHDISEIINLHQELEDTQKEIIYKMGEIGETRSKETGNHVKRVAEYSKLLALLYGINEKEAEILKLASPMHDIGKVGIPDSVLKKPGKLDPTEWSVMKTHAELGYEMLKNSNRPILKAAATVAGEHHERWDGLGYPKGKKGEDIHIYGRITAIADVFDALGSERCYKKAWTMENILELFEEEKGKQFDPNLIDLFFTNLSKFLEIQKKFKD